MHPRHEGKCLKKTLNIKQEASAVVFNWVFWGKASGMDHTQMAARLGVSGEAVINIEKTHTLRDERFTLGFG